ncbi:MAG: hypothetical protein EPO25_18165 [Gammaproteobacteria bacterium]|nr:MAG: hypothetical protein EPO25_18165 [Gammaproteobacteria bacterium]
MSALLRTTAAALAVLAPLAASGQDAFTEEFPLASCRFQPHGGNAYFVLDPNHQLYLSNQRCVAAGDCDELEEVWITTQPATRLITFEQDGKTYTVRTRVVEEFEVADGEVEEISQNYYASCAPMNDVYYFGEDVTDGDGNPAGDAWLAGVDGARPGIIMPDRAFLLGSRYYQEQAAGVAQDRAEHTAIVGEVTVPAGSFEDCVEVTETSPLEPGQESLKVYCPGIGLVIDNDMELAAHYRGAVARPEAGEED